MNDDEDLRQAIAIARQHVEGSGTPLQVARDLLRFINVRHSSWQALDGANGPLAALYIADDEADRAFFLGGDVERWHPDVRERKRAELLTAEARMAPYVAAACRALIDYGAARNVH